MTGTDDGVDLGRVREVFGDRLLRYLLNSDHQDPLGPELTSTEGRQEVVAVLRALLTQSKHLDDDDLLREFEIAPRLGSRPAGHVMALANLLRTRSGGGVPEAPTTQDPVAAAILSVLPDAYPLLLLPESGRFGMSRSLVSVTRSDSDVRVNIELALSQDPALSLLFSDRDEMGPAGSSMRSTGQGSGTQLGVFPDQQITNAWERASLTSDDPTLADVATALEANLDAIRSAIRNEPASVPVTIGLTGVLLPEELDALELGWGRVRRISARERLRAGTVGTSGGLTNTLPTGETVLIDYGGDLVLEAAAPYLVRRGPLEPTTPWPTQLQATQARTMEWLESLQLGLALAMDDVDEPVNVVPSWQVFLDPLGSPGNRSSWDTRQATGIIPRRLQTSQAESWAKWARTVQEHRVPEVGVAVRRMLMALNERRRPEDMLVDAVVVWENLFGASGETVFRVSAAIAWLLAEGADDRRARQKDCKTIYDLRSDVVHGNVNKKVNDAAVVASAARRAVAISLDVLREVFSDRTDLLAIRQPAERGIAVILGTG